MNHLCFYYSTDRKKDESINVHTHSCWEIVYYKSCAGKTDIGGIEYHFRENTFAILPPQVPHNETHFQGGHLTFIGFEAENLKIAGGIFNDDPYQNIKHLVSRIQTEAKNKFSDSKQMVDILIRELTVYLNRLQSPNPVQTNGLRYAKRFIDENYSWKINFIDLAKSCGYTFDSFRYSFKKEYGVSPKSYLIDLRLEKAKTLLESNEQNCTQIAYTCGFSNAAQFSTMFRLKYGITPKDFARIPKETEEA